MQLTAQMIHDAYLQAQHEVYHVPETQQRAYGGLNENEWAAYDRMAELLNEQVAKQESPTSDLKERYTPGLWKARHVGGTCWQIVSMIDEKPIAVVIASEADARLIVEAPNLFQLVKQGLLIDTGQDECHCSLCVAARRIVQRVLEG